MGHFASAAAAAIVILSSATVSVARQNERLTSLDGTVVLNGTVAGWTERDIIVEMSVGRMRIDRSLVTCEGLRCPVPETVRPVARVR